MATSDIDAPTGRGSPGAIPHNLSSHPCIDFVNSQFTDHTGRGLVYDRLEMEEWRRWFADRCGLVIHQPPSAMILRDLVNLRQLLRQLLESGQQPDDHAVAELDRWLVRPSLSWELGKGDEGVGLRLRWREQGWPALKAAVAVSYVQLLVTGGIERVRVCANPDCSYLFYDETRNQSRRWCDVAICGNLLKVRHHRAEARA